MSDKKVLVENVMGIKKLEIEDNNFKHFIESKVISIYGANGVGKSSLKEAMTNQKAKRTWNAVGKKVVDEEIKHYKNIAIFDELIVKIIKGTNIGSSMIFLNRKIDSLFELLSNIKNIKLKFNKQIPKFDDIFNIDEKILKDLKEHNDNIKNDIDSVLVLIKTRGSISFRNVNQIIRQSINSIQYISRKLYVTNYDFSVSNRTLEGINSPFNRELFTDFIINIFQNKSKMTIKKQEDILKKMKDFTKNMNVFINSIFELKYNFGYMPPKKEISNIIDSIKKMKMDTRNLHWSWIKSLINLSEKKRDELNESWKKNSDIVTKKIEQSNSFLNIYNLDYEIILKRTTISSVINQESNFWLKSKTTKHHLALKEIEKSVSYGELNIISLCIFISSISLEKKKKDVVILFDDPISSYDLNRVHISLNIIDNFLIKVNEIKKVFFFSHEKYFINLTKRIDRKDSIKKTNLSIFHLLKGNPSSLKYCVGIESDISFVKRIWEDDENHIFARATAWRQFIEIKNFINGKNNKKSENFNLLSSIIHSRIDEWNEKHSDLFGLSLKEFKEKIKEEPDFDKLENIIGVRSWIEFKSPDFFGKNKEKLINISLKEIEVLSLELVLDNISHFNDGELNYDTSRLSEIVDLVFANKKKLMQLIQSNFDKKQK